MRWDCTVVRRVRRSHPFPPPIASASRRSCAVTDYGMLFRELAIPRLVGSANHGKVREILKRELAARGFRVEEHAFTGRPSSALFGTPRVISGVNLIARPAVPSPRPVVWLVAHYDSKGQPISMALRLLGFFGLALSYPALFLSMVPAAALMAISLMIILQNRVNDNSPGAVDNATALVAIFMTLDQLPRDAAVGVIFPDAEEFGLVGARCGSCIGRRTRRLGSGWMVPQVSLRHWRAYFGRRSFPQRILQCRGPPIGAFFVASEDNSVFGPKTQCVVVVGAQWGDEGKGKIVDVLAERADLVVRYQGGANAGHTVDTGEGKSFVLHQIPSGILQGAVCVVGNGVVLDPEQLFAELDAL